MTSLPRLSKIGVLAIWLCGSISAPAASSGLIVSGLSGSSSDQEEFHRLSAETKRLLVERGLPIDRVEILQGKVTRDAILQKLQAASSGAPEDEFWLVLYGYSGKGQGGSPTFQVSGPRLTAGDLKTALDAIPAQQFIFIGTAASGGFLPILQNNRRMILSATLEEGESDWPRMPAAWVVAFAENPKASFIQIGARAAQRVETEYINSSLAQSEHSRLTDPVSGKILEPPFGVNLVAPPEVATTKSTSPESGDVPEAEVKMQDPKAEWEQQPATTETRKILAEAQSAPNPAGCAALMLEQRMSFTVEEDRTTDRLVYYRVWLAREEAVENWANPTFPQSPPMMTTKLTVARVIHPDGSATVYNPARLVALKNPESGEFTESSMIYLPKTTAGCVVEIGYRTRQVLDATLPHVSENLPLQRDIPILKSSLEVRVPEKKFYHVVVKNPDTTPVETTENGRRILRWQFGPLAAAESLPGDPPPSQWQTWLGISSLPSWDEFGQWYRRLAKGSDEADDSVKKMAAQLAAGATSRMEIIRRDFEFASALRYVAIEIGVQGFRPRKPGEVLANRYGDCKDKANLLVALMRCQKIDANFVLLNRGSATAVDFPSWQFNHAIAFVPKASANGQTVDLWLDSTDGVTPFGFVSPGDYGRAGLVFNSEKVEFKNIASAASVVTEIHDDWTLQEDANHVWQGHFQRRTTGIAVDGLRRLFRSLTPAQKQVQLYRLLAQIWPAADFSKGQISDGIELQAEVTAAGSLPLADFPGLEFFSSPERDRLLLLNDGQPVTVVQTVILKSANQSPPLPPAFETQVAGEKMSLTWERVDAQTSKRTARIELHQTTIPAADYAALREAIRKWQSSLAH